MQPAHVAVIMDGNGRWAKSRSMGRGKGHVEGAEAVRRVVRHARKLNIECLTLFAFSSLNWGRPTKEVADLMALLLDFLESERQEMLDNDIRLTAIGEREYLPGPVRAALARVEADTAHCRSMDLVLAVSYDGRRDMVRAAKRLAALAASGQLLPADVSEAHVMNALSTREMLDVDLLIRTSGELRMSGFLPLEACYAELYFTDKLWPDFTEADLDAAIAEYARRQRRFGLVLDQVASAPA
ncbi:MAG: polyprenyl diphosphate synthase [Myxococcota bacterium]|nr:polyprenyl diphosphate synthase [Myxococcota bacterium]